MQRIRLNIGTIACLLGLWTASVVRGEETETPPPNEFDGPTQVSPPGSGEPLLDIPGATLDPAFERYVDIQQLSKGYLARDPGMIADVGLQLLEAERILLRAGTLKGATVLELAMRVAANQGDVQTLQRIERAASRVEDPSFAQKIKLAQQLAAQPRSAPEPAPEADEKLTPEQSLKLHAQLGRLTRSLDAGDTSDLRALQAEVQKNDLGGVALNDYLQKQVAAAVEQSSPVANDDVSALLAQLTSASRAGTISGPHLETDPSGNIRQDARCYWLDSSRPHLIWIEVPGRPNGGGWNEWVPKNSYYGLVGRYGRVKIATGQWIEGENNQGRVRVRIKDFEGGYNPDWVEIEYWSVRGNKWYGNTFIGLKDAMTFTYDGDNALSRICNIVRGDGDTYRPAGLVKASRGTLKLADPSRAAAFSMKVMNGPHTQDINRGAVTLPSKPNVSGNIVAAGGGNVVYEVAKIVAAGGGNLIGDGGGTIVAAGGGNLISKGGAGLTVARSGQSGTAASRLARSKTFSAR